ncbi:MAG: hypothetical protein GX444_11155 [Myxococcales bacterium]|nr:hypothetical protein [Myxococcales bacterium]
MIKRQNRRLGWWIALGVLCLLLAPACHKEKAGGAPTPEDPNQRDVRVAKKLPNVPLYPSGKVIERAYAPDGSFQVRLLTAATSENLLAFYEKRLEPLGWKRLSEKTGDEYLAIYRKGREVILLSIFATDNPEEVLHILTYKEE